MNTSFSTIHFCQSILMYFRELSRIVHVMGITITVQWWHHCQCSQEIAGNWPEAILFVGMSMVMKPICNVGWQPSTATAIHAIKKIKLPQIKILKRVSPSPLISLIKINHLDCPRTKLDFYCVLLNCCILVSECKTFFVIKQSHLHMKWEIIQNYCRKYPVTLLPNLNTLNICMGS